MTTGGTTGGTTAVTTYRYVRGALLAIVAILTVSVLAETARTHWQISLSSYYYTAAGHVFVAAMAAIGVCLVALRGYTDAEDVFLNLAGLAAPTVGFVPTPVPHVPFDQPAIANNMLSYLGVLLVGVVVVAAIQVASGQRPSSWGRFGYASTVVGAVAGIGWLLVDRSGFCADAHYLASAALIGAIAVVVLLNTDWGVRVIARTPAPSRARFGAAYGLVFAGMAGCTVAWLVLTYAVDVRWPYLLLVYESVMLALVVAFWILQTVDLWDPERALLRADPPG